MRYFGQLLWLAVLALMGLGACAPAIVTPSAVTPIADSATATPDGPTLPAGQAAFLVSYADW